MLREPFRRTAVKFCEEVLVLADVLNSCGGIICQFDGYDTPFSETTNWSVWTSKMIEKCDFVITVCSPMLRRVFEDPQHELVNMSRGKFYADAIVNYISPHKFIPVFLNSNSREEWIPRSLQTATVYELEIESFEEQMGDAEGMHPAKFDEKMSNLLSLTEFDGIASLVAMLRKEAMKPRPTPPSKLVRPPSLVRGLFQNPFRIPSDRSRQNVLGDFVTVDGVTDSRPVASSDSTKSRPVASGVATKSTRQVRRADTNVIGVKFSTLAEPFSMHTGDPVLCDNEQCTAVLSNLSQLHKNGEKEVWRCEFCCSEKEIDLVPEEIPSKETATYLITPAPPVTGASANDAADSMIVFCVDVSGSMCVSTEIPGKFKLKGHDHVHCTELYESLNAEGDSQFLPSQKKDSTYVSRLQSVQAAVEHQLQNLMHTDPRRRVAVITFGDEVTVLGDGLHHPLTVAGDKLHQQEVLETIASELPLPGFITHTKDTLCQKIFSLKDGGQTALGPALIISVQLASRLPGSKVVICTDGCANKGIGNVDDIKTQVDHSVAQSFYKQVGCSAQEKGVVVSLTTMSGTNCRIMELGQVADKTGGQVLIVDPMTITKDFNNILASPTIATNVTIKVVLHSNLYIRLQNSHESVFKEPVGNVTAATEVTYEFGVKQASSLKEKCHVSKEEDPLEVVKSKHDLAVSNIPLLMKDGKPHYTFQLHIEYTSPEGARLMRVTTQAMPVTSNRALAESEIDVGVVSSHTAHCSAELAVEGEYSEARMKTFATEELIKRSSDSTRDEVKSAMKLFLPLESCLHKKQKEEKKRSATGCSISGDEMSYNARRNLRQMDADDELSALLYNARPHRQRTTHF